MDDELHGYAVLVRHGSLTPDVYGPFESAQAAERFVDEYTEGGIGRLELKVVPLLGTEV